MKRKKILFVLHEDEKAYGVFRLIDDFENASFDVSILKTKVSENLLPVYYWKKYLVNGGSFDFLIIYPINSKFKSDLESENRKNQVVDFLLENNLPYLGVTIDERFNTQSIIETVKCNFKSNKLSQYSFLVTVGGLKSPFDSQHYLAGYQNLDFLYSLIKKIILDGGLLTVITTENQELIPFAKDVIYVKNIEEYQSVLNAKAFKYDIILDGCKIPRFSLFDGEEVCVEYQKFYAELKESYLPFNDNSLLSNDQVIIKFFDGYEMDLDSVDYYFKNTSIHGIISNEMHNKSKSEYRGFSKLYTREHSLRVVFYQKIDELSQIVINKCIKMLERS